MPNSGWYQFAGGLTLGQVGSEGGTIVRDEDHVDGARITLEEGPGYTRAQFTITCGVYGWMVHTRFFDKEEEASREVKAMKQGLEDVLAAIAVSTDINDEAQMDRARKACARFVERYP